MSLLGKKLKESSDYLQRRIPQSPHLGVILGSGLGNFADLIENSLIIATGEKIPHCPRTTVPGHDGLWIFGKIANKPLLVLKGRLHFYEGHSMSEVVYPIYLMHKLKIRNLIITNAAGGINPLFHPGDLMLVVDHINFFMNNPLIGINNNQGKNRFPDMSHPYYPPFLEIAENTAIDLKIPLQSGVLIGTPGPNYETAAEVEMFRRLGADAVTMSTVPEVITANQLGVKVLGLSCITNMATGISEQKLNHAETINVAKQAQNKFQQLMKAIIERLPDHQ